MRSHLFQGNDYYPGNGIMDYVKSFDNPEEAKQWALDNPKWDWYIVLVDTPTGLSEYYRGRHTKYL